MKIYYKLNTQLYEETEGIPSVFCGLVSMDIGYRSYGITIVNKDITKFKTIDFVPIKQEVNLSKLGIPEYVSLATDIADRLTEMINSYPVLQRYYWSMEIPNIIGSYAPALSILVGILTTKLLGRGVPAIFFTMNKLGGYYLKQRKYTKVQIRNFVIDKFKIDHKITDHEADSVLQAYSICKGVFHTYLQGIKLREFEPEIKNISIYE